MAEACWLARGRPATAPAVIAHRGGAALGPENELSTVRTAMAAGAAAVEVDVQELRDGSLVLAHDGYLRQDGAWHWMRDLEPGQVRGIVESQGGRLAGVDELLALSVAEGVGLYIELKMVSPRALIQLTEDIVAVGLADRCVLGSFRADLVAQAATDGRVASSLLYHDRSADPVALVDDLGCPYIHPCFDGDDRMIPRMTGAWMERVWARGAGVVSWNANEPRLLDGLRNAGVSGVCTDDPRVVPWLGP